MVAMELTPATVVIALVVLALAALAVWRLVRRGMCDCHDHCGTSEGGCAGCGAVDTMLANMDKAVSDAPNRSALP